MIDALRAELLKYQTHLSKAEAKLEAGRAELAATESELAKAIAWLGRCQWARNAIDLDAGPLEVQLADAEQERDTWRQRAIDAARSGLGDTLALAVTKAREARLKKALRLMWMEFGGNHGHVSA